MAPAQPATYQNLSDPQVVLRGVVLQIPTMRSMQRRCRWECGGRTKNISGICDGCWADRERLNLERTAQGAAAKESKLRTEAQRNALRKARETRAAKLLKELPVTGV